ncbi:uncharacterized protein LOC143181022 [Calliopsis andreniformis]|uniref:uncharacterized protein LOC143181022 n=1 Tax=Calliopsis andreniformis TaxID=337506 RepID=UPI003FCDC44B
MKKVTTTFRGNAACLGRLILFGLTLSTCLGSSNQAEWERRRLRTPMHKVELTQKGYIQFLRWELPVPEIREFTFCLWLKSNDLTHPHSIFSYSKNERERLVRAWIAPHGKSIHLKIGGTQVFETPSDILENRWYHVCQSWENKTGRYGLWINGNLWTHGSSQKTLGHVIPSGGDIVLGQEYTDFDKGLEDGIEGSVLGFNLLLASAFDPLAISHAREASYDSNALPSASSYARSSLVARIPTQMSQRGVVFVPVYHHRFRRHVNDRPAGRSEEGSRRIDLGSERAGFDPSRLKKEPLGLQLVKLSYVRCEIGRGSPFIGGPLMLISWSRTPVRVFGGAVLKNVNSDCGNF